jgi:hypothetical protein
MNQPSKNFVNQIHCCKGIVGMKMLPDECVAVVVTSPPYAKPGELGCHVITPEVIQRIPQELLRITDVDAA